METSFAMPVLPAAAGVLPVVDGAGATSAPGLFGTLVAGGVTAGGVTRDALNAAPATPLTDTLEEGLVPTLATPSALDGLLLHVQQPVLPGGQVQVQGTVQAVQQLAVQVQVLYQSLVETGTLTVSQFAKSSDLTAALIQQGMAPEEAAAYAQRIETMLDVLEAQGLVQDSVAGELAMTLLASLMQGAQQPSLHTIQVTTHTEQLVVQVSVQQSLQQSLQGTGLGQSFGAATGPARWPGQHPALQGLDLARAVLGHGAPVLPSDIQPELATLPAEALVQVQTVPAEVATAAVQVVLGSGQTAAPTSKPAPTGGLGTGAGAAQPVALEALVQAPSGVEQFRWQRAGEQEVLKALPVQQAQNDEAKVEVTLPSIGVASSVPVSLPDTAPPALAATANVAALPPVVAETGPFAAPVLDHATLSARLELAQQARVAQQLTLQFQPLADTGGGKVRMTLNPPELGRIDVELTIRNGEVQGSVAASDRAVLEHLVRELPTLRQGLADAGLRVNEQGLSLLLNDGGNGQQAGQQFGQQAAQSTGNRLNRGQGDSEGLEPDSTDTLASRWVAPERLMDVRV